MARVGKDGVQRAEAAFREVFCLALLLLDFRKGAKCNFWCSSWCCELILLPSA